MLKTLVEVGTSGSRRVATLLGEKYKHFQHYEASTVYVLGEFPWQVRRGETAVLDDFISPPRLLSREQTSQEVTWSIGEYTLGADLWAAFKLKGAPPASQGIYANQPAPTKGSHALSAWKLFLVFV